MRITSTRAAAAVFSAALNLGVLALVMRSGADTPPMWEETVMTAQLVQVRGGANNAPVPSAQAPSSPLREPAPTTPLRTSQQSLAASDQAPAAAPVAVAAIAQASAVTPAAAVARPAVPAAQRAGTRDGLDIDAANGASLDYASRLRAWLEAHKTYPRRARMRREEGVVHLQFAVDRQGRLLGGDVVRSSGHDSLDAEAMAMLDRSNPFPGAPHGIRGERIEVSTPVEFYLKR